MTPQYEQRRELVRENATIIRQWLALSDDGTQEEILRSLVKEFSLPDLRKMNAHVKEQLAKTQEATK